MPPPSGKSLTKGKWRALALSILLHSSIVAAAVYGWFTWKHRPPPVETLAIEASVVDERALKGIAPAPKPAPEPAPPEPVAEPEPAPVEEQGPPKPDPAEIQRKEEERLALEKAAQEKVEEQKREQEQKAVQELKEREDAERVEAEKQAAAKAAAEKAAQEKALQEKAMADKRAAEKKRVEDAAAAKKAAEEKARVAREAELRRALEAEELGNAARNSDVAMRWHAQITGKIERAWIKPPSARPGISCIVSVTQVPGGDVTGVRVNSCSIEDAALRESVEAAVYRASPLPTPPAGVPFERNLELTFAPTS
jgi:colicin import membrane protein